MPRASAENLDAVALVDGDGQHDPAQLPALAALLASYDFVIGARSKEAMPMHRRLSNWLVNRGFRWIGGVDFVDVQSGLRLYRKLLVDVLARHLAVDGGYSLEHESLAVLAAWSSQHAVELSAAAAPISCAYGEAKSKMRFCNIVQLGVATIRQALRIRHALAGRERLSTPRALTVEIHDVSPATRTEVAAIAQALVAIGIERVSLLGRRMRATVGSARRSTSDRMATRLASRRQRDRAARAHAPRSGAATAWTWKCANAPLVQPRLRRVRASAAT